jgi:hypothetical protein
MSGEADGLGEDFPVADLANFLTGVSAEVGEGMRRAFIGEPRTGPKVFDGLAAAIGTPDEGEVICDGGRPLWPVRWNWLRHGTWNYRVFIVGLDDAGPTVGWSWPAPPSRKLCIDGREYRRRQRARAKRRRR